MEFLSVNLLIYSPFLCLFICLSVNHFAEVIAERIIEWTRFIEWNNKKSDTLINWYRPNWLDDKFFFSTLVLFGRKLNFVIKSKTDREALLKTIKIDLDFIVIVFIHYCKSSKNFTLGIIDLWAYFILEKKKNSNSISIRSFCLSLRSSKEQLCSLATIMTLEEFVNISKKWWWQTVWWGNKSSISNKKKKKLIAIERERERVRDR